MSNEELVIQIQDGNTALMALLWERVYKLINMLCGKYYRLHEEQCTKAGIEQNDLMQEGYFVMIKAIEAFDSEKEYKFNTYISYLMQSHFNGLIGLITTKAMNEPLNNCDSLDTPISADNDSDITLEDTLKDDNIPDFNEALERQDLKRLIWGEVEKLPSKYSYILIQRYKYNKTLKELSTEQGLCMERIRQIARAGLVKLKRDSKFKKQIESYIPTRHISLSEYKRTFTSATEWAVLWREQHLSCK